MQNLNDWWHAEATLVPAMQGASGGSGKKQTKISKKGLGEKVSKKGLREKVSSPLYSLYSCNRGAAARSIVHLERKRLRAYAITLLSGYLPVTGEHGQGQ